MVVQTYSGIKQDPFSKTAKANRVGGMAQMVQCLPSKYKALGSISSIEEKNNKTGSMCTFHNKCQLCTYRYAHENNEQKSVNYSHNYIMAYIFQFGKIFRK
jgi:hypothetical protein